MTRVTRRRGRRGTALALLAVALSGCTSAIKTPPSVSPPPGPAATTAAGDSFAPAAAAFPTFLPADLGEDLTPMTFPTMSVPDAGERAPVRFTRTAIFDPAAGNIQALVFLVPDGWQAQGQVHWLPEWRRLTHLQTTVSEPASGITIDWLPIQDFIWFEAPAGLSAPIGGNYQGKGYVPPITDPVQFVGDFWTPNVLSHLGGLSPTTVSQVPAIAQEYARQFGGPAQAFAYRLRYEFEQNGQPWEEDVSFALLYSGSSGVTSWFVNFAYTVRAPRGELDRNAGTINTVIASRVTTPAWEGVYGVVQGLFTQGLRQQMADTEAFGRTLAQHRAESAALQQQVTQQRQDAQNRIADLRQEVLGGVETYIDPVNRELVQLPVGWNEYWVNPKGEYLTSDTPGFDPNQFDNAGWQRLQRRTP